MYTVESVCLSPALQSIQHLARRSVEVEKVAFEEEVRLFPSLAPLQRRLNRSISHAWVRLEHDQACRLKLQSCALADGVLRGEAFSAWLRRLVLPWPHL